MPLLAIQGLLDDSVPFAGGVGSGVSGTDFASQVQSVLPFVALGGGSWSPVEVALPYAVLWYSSGGAGGADTAYFLTLDGGHTWPASAGSAIDVAQPVHTAVPATPLMFDWFELQGGR